MVTGLDIFRKYFKGFESQYVLIGGTASSIVMEDAGINFRATKDLDIVLCIESFNSVFAQRFWEFIETGKYSNRQKSTGKNLFYRFHSPKNKEYPYMLELFSKVPDSLQIPLSNTVLTPIPVEDDISSLSAILLDSGYYNFIHQNSKVIEGLPVVGPEILIPLKARAWLDLSARKASGEYIDSRDIKKHRNDIFRLFPLLPGNSSINCQQEIKYDLKRFCGEIVSESGLNLKSLGIRTLTLTDVISKINEFYHL